MKRKWIHPEPAQEHRKMVRSMGELEDTPEFRDWLEREFPAGAAEMRSEEDRDVSRRSFMKFMGASTALAGFGMAACRRPETHILPFSKAVEWVIPGKALFYATAMPRLGGCTPLVATTYEGRPTHLQGNPLHPGGVGLDSIAASSVLDLYDPERSAAYLKGGESTTADAFNEALAAKKRELGLGKGLAILHGESTSPTRARLLGEVRKKFPEAKTYRYEPINLDNVAAANEALFGKGVVASYDFSKADRILAIGCDFLGADSLGEGTRAAFARRRGVEGGNKMNRLYVLEHAYTVTGGTADHRLPVNASLLAAAAAEIAKLLGDDELAALAGKIGGDSGLDGVWVGEAVKDLVANKGKCLVVAGPALDPAVHVLVAGMNKALGSYGSTINVLQGPADDAGSIGELAQAIDAKEVSTLVITTECDPAYDAPANLKFAEKLAAVDSVIHIGVRSKCATARAADWHVPSQHYLESWGDVRAADGTYSVVQPMILPLYGGVSENDFYRDLLTDPPAPDAKPAEPTPPIPGQPEPDDPAMLAVKETFRGIVSGSDKQKAWESALRDGFVANTGYQAAPTASPNLSGGEALVSAAAKRARVSSSSFEVVFTPDSKVYDGRFINNAWQQEAPDPITKVVWDNAALISVKTLKEFGLSRKDIATLVDEDETRLLRVTVNGAELVIPFIAAPGHAHHSLSISMGYGQTDAGRVAGGFDDSGTGFNCFPLRTASSTYIATGAKVELVDEKVEIRPGAKKSKKYPIALTQQHNLMEGRAIVRDGTLKEFEKDPDFAKTRGMDSHIPQNMSVYKGQEFDFDNTHQWAMTIDLNSCIGCNACLVSCQSENNIPVVGKEQTIIGREMHWIRLDRYYAPDADDHGHELDEDLENPQMLTQPMACQQCEAAPCETVCPVNATVHNEEGLNVMAYNRCIGTRYCANNCPYKARRFNYFDYNKRPIDELYRGPLSSPEKTGVRESLKLQKNPNVTVRMRGVMEKCTYCVQRIQEAKINRKQIARDDTSKLRVPDGGVKTACQTACPVEAIQFGDIADKNSAVSKAKDSPRDYNVLEFLGTRPRTSYLARVKNPNMKIPGAEQIGTVTKKMH